VSVRAVVGVAAAPVVEAVVSAGEEVVWVLVAGEEVVWVLAASSLQQGDGTRTLRCGEAVQACRNPGWQHSNVQGCGVC
jgi:hypothetical protein